MIGAANKAEFSRDHAARGEHCVTENPAFRGIPSTVCDRRRWRVRGRL